MKTYLRKSVGVILFIGSFWLPFYIGSKFFHYGTWHSVPLVVSLFALYFVMIWQGAHLILDKP